MKHMASYNVKCSDHQLTVILCMSLPLCCGERKEEKATKLDRDAMTVLAAPALCSAASIQYCSASCGDGGCTSGRSVAPALETPPEEWASSHGLAHVPWLRDGQGTMKEEHLGVVSWDLEITVSSPQDQSARSSPSQQTWCTQIHTEHQHIKDF